MEDQYQKLINESFFDYARSVDKLRNIIRYATAPRTSSESVAEHSFFVASYVLKLYEYYDFNLQKALSMALLHDFSEAYISDVPHPVKAGNPELNEALEKAERKVNAQYLSEEVANWIEEMNHLSSYEGMICVLADVISVVTYAKYEMDLGNKAYMKGVYDGSKNRYIELVRNLCTIARKDPEETTKNVLEQIFNIFSQEIEQ